MKESDLYKPIKKLLESKGYEVYAEVEPHAVGNWGARADIVATNYPAVTIVEMKTSLSLDLVEQAYSWLPHAHYIYIAIPKRNKAIPSFMLNMLKRYGIGVIEVSHKYGTYATITTPARFNRARMVYPVDWKKVLKPEHKTWVEGGANAGGHVTSYKLTIKGVKDYLRKNPEKWHSMNDILLYCETHYASPKNSLAKALTEFENDWCEVSIIARKRHYRMKKGVRT